MVQSLPLVLVPGLTCTARLYGPQIAALWPFGQVLRSQLPPCLQPLKITWPIKLLCGA